MDIYICTTQSDLFLQHVSLTQVIKSIFSQQASLYIRKMKNTLVLICMYVLGSQAVALVHLSRAESPIFARQVAMDPLLSTEETAFIKRA